MCFCSACHARITETIARQKRTTTKKIGSKVGISDSIYRFDSICVLCWALFGVSCVRGCLRARVYIYFYFFVVVVVACGYFGRWQHFGVVVVVIAIPWNDFENVG